MRFLFSVRLEIEYGISSGGTSIYPNGPQKQEASRVY